MIYLHDFILEQRVVSLMVLVNVVALNVLVSLSLVGDIHHAQDLFDMVILIHVVSRVFNSPLLLYNCLQKEKLNLLLSVETHPIICYFTTHNLYNT